MALAQHCITASCFPTSPDEYAASGNGLTLFLERAVGKVMMAHLVPGRDFVMGEYRINSEKYTPRRLAFYELTPKQHLLRKTCRSYL